MSRTRVKICGLTRSQDAALAAALGADALGVVFAESPRRVSRAQAAAVLDAAPVFVARVGVFADQEEAFILETIRRCRLDRVQLSGREPAELARSIPVPVIRAVHLRAAADLVAARGYPADAFLLDAPPLGRQMGGTGRTFDWEQAGELPWPRERVIAAGGLNPENVGALIARLRPGAVDVSSGVESAPGVKDPAKLEAFFAAVAAADAARDHARPRATLTPRPPLLLAGEGEDPSARASSPRETSSPSPRIGRGG